MRQAARIPMTRFETWLYRRIDARGRIPAWARFVYRYAHWCPGMDDLLILTAQDMLTNCHCTVRAAFVGGGRVDSERWNYKPEDYE